MKIKS